MKTYLIYPKEGVPFTLLCERFELRENHFVLYNSRDEESSEGFLSLPLIAAIVPEQQLGKVPRAYPNTPITFRVYLRDKHPIEIFASAFKADDTRVTFWIQRKDMMDKLIDEWPLNDVYVATSELIAIIPSDGLQSR